MLATGQQQNGAGPGQTARGGGGGNWRGGGAFVSSAPSHVAQHMICRPLSADARTVAFTSATERASLSLIDACTPTV